MAGARSAVTGVVVAAAVAAAGYWYWSPVLAVQSMRAAAEKGDADQFNNYVDYPLAIPRARRNNPPMNPRQLKP